MSHVRATSAGCIAAGLVVLALFLAACSPTESMMGSPSTSPTTSPADSRNAYANANILANPDWLAELLTDPKMRVVALVPRADYQRGHIPGAVQIDWPDLQVTDTSDPSIERWRGEVEQKLGGLGISFDDTVVIYDHGSLFAARLWWVLDQLGLGSSRQARAERWTARVAC